MDTESHPTSGVVGSVGEVCVALPAIHHDNLHGRDYETGFFKVPVHGVIAVSEHGLAGDGQSDLINHGGPDKAVLTYPASNYAHWHHSHPDLPMGPGAFGENLCVEGVDETTVCVHDRWRVGTVIFELSQPRQPCWKLEARWATAGLINETNASGRTGWYHRVIEGGHLQAGDEVMLLERPAPQWPIALAYATTMSHASSPDALKALRAIPGLAASWQTRLSARLERLGRLQ